MFSALEASLVTLQERIRLQCRQHGFDPWVRQIPWRRKWQPSPVVLPGGSHGQRSLAGYSPWGCRVRHLLVTKQQQLCFALYNPVNRYRCHYVCG